MSHEFDVTVRKTIPATPKSVFEAWTNPEQLKKWWGPKGVECTEAAIDLQVGGQYRIANQFADGTIIWIQGEFERIEPPSLLQYTWGIGLESIPEERVTVRFEAIEGGTEVVVFHEMAPDEAARKSHEGGWQGCLDGLFEFVTSLS